MKATPYLLLCLLGFSCAAGPGEFVSRPATQLTWPLYDSQPRMSVLFTYHDSRDVERSPGFLAKVGDWMLGEDIYGIGSPYGLCIAPQTNELLIADTGLGAMHMISMETCEHRVIFAPEDQPMKTPVGITTLPDGRIFVTDSTVGEVFTFSSNGDFEGTLNVDIDLGRPTGIAWDSISERLLVLDTTGGRLLSFSATGELLAELGSPGEEMGYFNHPTNLAVGPEGRIYITDSLNFRIQVLEKDLTPAWQFGLAGNGPGAFAKPKGIAVDSEGHVYVVDAMFDNIQVFDPQGVLLLTFCQPGNSFGRLSLPTGLHIDSLDRVFVSDAGNSRIQAFQYHSIQP